MKAEKNKGFTLIELIAVLVILAILALIVTPIVLSIVKNAKDAANKRSVDAYGKTVELSVATYMLDNGEYPKCQSDLKIEYSGNEVNCNIMNLNENGSVYLSECTVGGKEVKDSSTNDGWYHYGKVSEISAESINNSYKIGDVVIYNEMDFYVIADSDDTQDSVTLLKAEPLTVDEVNTYGKNHVNRYTYSSIGTAYDQNGYGGMAYYTSTTCGYVGGSRVETGCTTDYNQSEIKYVVDTWAANKIKSNNLKVDATGYGSRLITYEELRDNLGYNHSDTWDATSLSLNKEYTPDWVYNNNYWYWTMSTFEDYNDGVWAVSSLGRLSEFSVYSHYYGNGGIHGGGSLAVRPVINLYKSAINNPNSQKVSNVIDLKCS